jgi:hypothetical protein
MKHPIHDGKQEGRRHRIRNMGEEVDKKGQQKKDETFM